MKTIFLATAAAFAFAAPAVAQSQLETSLGVSAGTFTTAQLIQLDRAYEENDQTRINFILSGGSNLDAAESERRGIEQSVARFIEEGEVAQANNLQAARGVTASNSVASSRGESVVPGSLQSVADDLGVDPGAFTTGELVALGRYYAEGDMARVQGMISRIAN
jgi:hypothetical protein